MSDTIHPAVLANMNSVKYVMEKNREAWLALYRDDATVADPVGKSPFDPEGKGHVGKEAIAAFYDNVIGPSTAVITPGERTPSGDHWCAVPMVAESDMGNGHSTRVEMICIYEVDDNGLIVSMRAFWDWSEMERQLKEIGFG